MVIDPYKFVLVISVCTMLGYVAGVWAGRLDRRDRRKEPRHDQ